MKTTKYLTTVQAARQLKVTRARVHQLIQADRFPGAIHLGRDWLIPAESVASFRGRPAGNPNFVKRKGLAKVS